MSPGTLYVVATPLGNLGDLSSRAAEILRSVPVVAAEDTRQHPGAADPPRRCAQPAELPRAFRRSPLDTLLGYPAVGRDVALVSDAGTPAVSDPGAELVALARAAGIAVVPIPGPSAVSTALSAAGFIGDRYLFLGFIPRKGGDRTRLLTRAATEEWSVVFCSRRRPGSAGLLADLMPLVGAVRRAVVARELTKLHEEIRAGTLAELADYYSETRCGVKLPWSSKAPGLRPLSPIAPRMRPSRPRRCWPRALTRREVVRRLTESMGLPRNDAYKLVMELP